jgi:D-alanyl-D-alanine carboxypeptidase
MAFWFMRVLAMIALIPLLALPSAADDPDFANSLRPKIDAFLKEGVTPGAMVLVDVPGKGTWIETFGTAEYGKTVKPDPKGHTHIGSITKTLTAQAVLLLVDDGKLKLDDTIESHMPGLVPNGATITLRQMLDMTSGLYNGTEDLAVNETFDTEPHKVWSPEEFIDVSLKHPPYFAPGAGFHYSNTNYEILGLVVEKVSGKPLNDFLAERVFAPLGMKNTTLPPRDKNGLPDPHWQGYFFGTNVDGKKAYDAAIAGDKNQAMVPWPKDKPPVDVTDWSLSYTWASGSAISTLEDMRIWAKAWATGSLLKPETRKAQQTWSPHAKYGLGITYPAGPLLGHNGAVPGFQSLIGYEPKSNTTVVVFANNQLEPNTLFVLPADAIATLIVKELFPQ